MPYADITYADAYHSERLSKEAWISLSEEERTAALNSASDTLDIYASSKGGWLEDYTSSTPADIKNACCIEALALCDSTAKERLKAQAQGVTSISIGSASESYSGVRGGTSDLLADAKTSALLARYLRQSGGGAAIL